jgi:hypothetical protein
MRGKAEIQYRDKFRKPGLDGVEAQAQRIISASEIFGAAGPW